MYISKQVNKVCSAIGWIMSVVSKLDFIARECFYLNKIFLGAVIHKRKY